jgi:hypothetical protein
LASSNSSFIVAKCSLWFFIKPVKRP